MSEPVRFASFSRRLLAAVIDDLFWVILIFFFVLPLAGGSSTAAIVLTFISLTAWFNYFAIAEWRWGQTIGKAILDLRVVPVEAHEKLTNNRAAVRNLLRLVDGPLALIGVDYAIVRNSPRRQRLGDRAAHTVVLHEEGLPMTGPVPGRDTVQAGAPPTASELFGDAAEALGGTRPAEAREEQTSPGHAASEPIPPPSEGWNQVDAVRDEGFAASVTWGPREAILGVLGALVAGLLLGIPALIIDNPPPNGNLSTGANVALQLATVIGFVGASIYVAARDGAPLAQALRRLGVRPFRPSAIGWMVVAAVAYLLLAALYAALAGTPKQEDIASSFGPVWVQIFLIVICAATSEELCFRGMLFGGLRKRLPAIAAALISGAIFGGLHAITGISAVPPLFVFGTILALLYERTGSIIPGILLHALNNSVALLGQ